jgi:hypothetical protein
MLASPSQPGAVLVRVSIPVWNGAQEILNIISLIARVTMKLPSLALWWQILGLYPIVGKGHLFYTKFLFVALEEVYDLQFFFFFLLLQCWGSN